MNRILNIQATILLLAAALLAACTQDELTDNGQGTPLPEPVPLTLAAGGSYEAAVTPAEPSTRGTIDDDWQNTSSVAVWVNGNIKEYIASGQNGNRATLVPAETPGLAETNFWWTEQGQTKTVYAWYPYQTGQTTIPKWFSISTVQTPETFNQNDLMFAEQKTVSQSDPSITFEHLLAKVEINLQRSEYLKNAQQVEVFLDKVYNKGKITGTNTTGYKAERDGGASSTTITPYELPSPVDGSFASYTALVIPLQETDGRSVSLCITVDGITYRYTPWKRRNLWSGGNSYSYIITVSEQGLSVTTQQTIGWNNTGNNGSGSVTVQ